MSSIIQIFGVKNCNDTNKALRFFKERRINIQFIDLTIKGLSKGELESVSRKIHLEDLINKNSKQFIKRNLEFMVYDLETELLEDPMLFKTPITRHGKDASMGYTPEVWKKWCEEINKK
jgi:arsenate reductase (glutaredoxin)